MLKVQFCIQSTILLSVYTFIDIIETVSTEFKLMNHSACIHNCIYAYISNIIGQLVYCIYIQTFYVLGLDAFGMFVIERSFDTML